VILGATKRSQREENLAALDPASRLDEATIAGIEAA